MFGRPDGVISELVGQFDLFDALVKGAPLALRRRLRDLDFEQDGKSHGNPRERVVSVLRANTNANTQAWDVRYEHAAWT